MVRDILSYGIGTLAAFAVLAGLAFLQLGEYFRQYFFSGDREEMPFNRATRACVYGLAVNAGSRRRSTCCIPIPSPRRG